MNKVFTLYAAYVAAGPSHADLVVHFLFFNLLSTSYDVALWLWQGNFFLALVAFEEVLFALFYEVYFDVFDYQFHPKQPPLLDLSLFALLL